ncbi:hypothetical protein HMPREF3192_01363 [Atopobium deltae]|uniref:Uncharacterized protein n=1 Tax=Atopobium deltae TaxID=1393034 RepID=A0A133XPX5_9ACTN|nr:hypothetical protein HMPREF3192_01363 [Atopobium deltae]
MGVIGRVRRRSSGVGCISTCAAAGAGSHMFRTMVRSVITSSTNSAVKRVITSARACHKLSILYLLDTLYMNTCSYIHLLYYSNFICVSKTNSP